MPLLNWVDDTKLESAVLHLLSTAQKAGQNAEKEFGKNVIDPFAAVFEMAGFEIDYKTWFKSETTRQAQKTLQNHIGEFHQIVLGSVKDWDNLKTGRVIDLISKKKKNNCGNKKQIQYTIWWQTRWPILFTGRLSYAKGKYI